MEFNFGNTYQPQASQFGVQGLNFNQPGIDPNIHGTDFGAPGSPVPGAPETPGFGEGSQFGQNVLGGVQALTGVANAYLGYKNYGLAKDQLAENQKQFNLNFNNQAQLTNNQLSDQFAVRADSGTTGDYGNVNEYLAAKGVKDSGGNVIGA